MTQHGIHIVPALVAGLLTAAPGGAGAQQITCTLVEGERGGFRGTCEGSGLARSSEIALTRAVDAGAFTWTGSLHTATASHPIDLAPPSPAYYRSGALRSPAWWFAPLDTFSLSDRVMHFAFDENAAAYPSRLDRRIVERAREIQRTSGWARDEPAECPAVGVAVGIWCALAQAAAEVVGYVHFRQPAMSMAFDAALQIAPERSGAWQGLRHYNSHPETTAEEVLAVLDRVTMYIDAGFDLRSTRSLGLGTEPSAAVTLGDADGDGHLDVVIANGRHWPAENRIYLNSGTGAFMVERPLPGDRHASYRILLVDLDGDGDLDIVEVNDRARNRIYLNRGDGTFDQAGTFGRPDAPGRDIAAGDLNGNGHADLFVVNWGGPHEICFNDGRGGFDECRDFTAEDAGIKVTLGDVDGDGTLDLILASPWGRQNHVFLNDGTGSFGERRPFGTGSDETISVAVADLDGDGHLDIVTANVREPSWIYYGDGRGSFDAGVELGNDTDAPYRVTVADANGDGLLDVLFANAWSANRIFLNRGGRGNFVEIQFGSPNDGSYGLAVGDLTGNGVADVVEANDGTVNRVFHGRVHR